MNQHQNQMPELTYQTHWQKHGMKYLGIFISLIAFYFWNIARETVTTPYQIVMLDQGNHPEILASNYQFAASDTNSTDSIYLKAATKAAPVGGLKAFNQYIKKNIKYPRQAYLEGISGQVLASFVIEKDGTISQLEIVERIGGGCDEEVIRLIENGPKWVPASHKGEFVRQRLFYPISFRQK